MIEDENEISDHEEEVDTPELTAHECELRQRAVKMHQLETLQFFSKKTALSTKSADEEEDELGQYDTEHDGYEFKVVLHEPKQQEMDANIIYVFEESNQSIAYKLYAPNQDHVPNDDKDIIKDFIHTTKLRKFKYPLTPANLSPCLEDIIDITKERGHTPGFGELSFELAFKG